MGLSHKFDQSIRELAFSLPDTCYETEDEGSKRAKSAKPLNIGRNKLGQNIYARDNDFVRR
jgi:hypothetical protein